jgi:hypothetical protein
MAEMRGALQLAIEAGRSTISLDDTEKKDELAQAIVARIEADVVLDGAEVPIKPGRVDSRFLMKFSPRRVLRRLARAQTATGKLPPFHPRPCGVARVE